MGNLERDFILLEEIERISYMIYKVYSMLQNEELKNGIGSTHYQILFDVLKDRKQKENNLYQCLELTPDKADNISGYLIKINNYREEYEDNILDAIKSYNIQGLAVSRILNRLSDSVIQDREGHKKWLIKKGIFLGGDVEDFLRFVNLKEAITSDIERAFLYFNQNRLCSVKRDEKAMVNRVKYNLLFLSQNMEQEFLNRQGSDIDEITFTFPFVGEFNGINKGRIEVIQQDSGVKVFCNSVVNLASLNPDFKGSELYYDYLSAGLSALLSLENNSLIYSGLKGYIRTSDEINNRNCSFSVEQMINFIDNFEKEKPKCKYLHFGQKQ